MCFACIRIFLSMRLSWCGFPRRFPRISLASILPQDSTLNIIFIFRPLHFKCGECLDISVVQFPDKSKQNPKSILKNISSSRKGKKKVVWKEILVETGSIDVDSWCDSIVHCDLQQPVVRVLPVGDAQQRGVGVRTDLTETKGKHTKIRQIQHQWTRISYRSGCILLQCTLSTRGPPNQCFFLFEIHPRGGIPSEYPLPLVIE